MCNSRLSPPDYTTPIKLTISGSASSTVHLRIRSVGAAGDIELPLGANALQARQGVQDFRHTMRGFVLRPQPLPVKCRQSLERWPEVQKATSLSSTAAGLLRDFLKSSSGALNFKKSLCRQGIGFRRCCFRSFASAHCMSAVLRKTTAPYVAVHFRNVCPGEARSSTLHRPVGQRSAARHSP